MTINSDYQNDVQHLHDLLSLSRDRRSAKEFWKVVFNDSNRSREVRNFFRPEKVADMNTNLDSAYAVARACLMLFDGEQPRLWGLVDRLMGREVYVTIAIGKRWSEDVCTTAWRIYVSLKSRQTSR